MGLRFKDIYFLYKMHIKSVRQDKNLLLCRRCCSLMVGGGVVAAVDGCVNDFLWFFI